MRPFLRWAGGKRWLSEATKLCIAADGRYVEPFIGGGSFFFSHMPPRALISDSNPFLINTYKWMRDAHDSLYCHVQELFDQHSLEKYYEVRKVLSANGIEGAAAFLYLNRSCFNGLYRVNLAGRFNVPMGSKLYALRKKDEFEQWARCLENTDIELCDFQVTVDNCIKGDVLFVDPPYTVRHNHNGFVEYNEKIFSWDDQVRLSSALVRAAERGVHFLLTNADHDSIRSLYEGKFESAVRERGSAMAADIAFRGRTSELLVMSSPDVLMKKMS